MFTSIALESIVVSILFLFEVVANIKTFSGISSKIFNNAFADAIFNLSKFSIKTTLYSPIGVFEINSAICLAQIV
jgi:hypothetical protein